MIVAMRRVVITGLGAVTPLGLSMGASFEALLAGRSDALGPITRFDASGLRWQTAGQLKGFDPVAVAGQKDALRYDPFVIYAYAAAREAASDAGLGEDALGCAGIVAGSGRGGITSIERAIPGRASAYLMAGSTISMAASYIAARLGARGGLIGISNACASGTVAIGEAYELIRSGRLELAVAGGAEAPVCGLCVRGYGASGALSRSGVMRPFDRKRDGFVLSEGACFMVLEERGAAVARGARIYAEAAGYGNTADAGHPTLPDPDGQSRAIARAMSGAGLANVDLISAHATSTAAGDRAEAEAVRMALGAYMPMAVAIKSMTGHMLAASGAFEAAASALCLRHGVLPPTLNTSGNDCRMDVSDRKREGDYGAALACSFGFGGTNAALVLVKHS